jgi:hypothetical protein
MKLKEGRNWMRAWHACRPSTPAAPSRSLPSLSFFVLRLPDTHVRRICLRSCFDLPSRLAAQSLFRR